MARGFGATLGAGTTDAIDTAYASLPANVSAHIWANRNGDGGAGLGRMIDMGAATQLGVYNAGSGNYATIYNNTPGASPWAAPSTGVWASIGLTYNGANIAGYQNGTLMANEGVGPQTAGTWRAGNRSDAIRNWDGLLAEYAIWDVLLTASDFGALAKGYSPFLIRPGNLVSYAPMLRSNIDCVIGDAPTITGTAIAPHPRIIMLRKNKSGRFRSAAPAQLQFIGFMGTSGV